MFHTVGTAMMKCCVFLLLLGSLFFCCYGDFPPGSCDGYTNITEPWRNFLYKSSSFPGYPKNDSQLVGKWWRFTGIGGDQAVSTCFSGPVGGAQYPIYVPLDYPTTENQTITGTAYGNVAGCGGYSFSLKVVLCPGRFYIYNPINHPYANLGYVTYHSGCKPDSCGPLAECSPVSSGGCICTSGYQMPEKVLPTPDSYGCVDINECQTTPGICGLYANCTNTVGSFFCTCQTGFTVTTAGSPAGASNPCIDVNECLENICGNGTCTNNIGSYVCICNKGYYFLPGVKPSCQDVDECLNATVCGPETTCTNIPASYTCACKVGFQPTDPTKDPSPINICIDVVECVQYEEICGPNSNCSNIYGSYLCYCLSGYRLTDGAVIASINNPCIDIDECTETPGICGKQTVCTNVPGTFYCSCPEGFFPSTGILWTLGVSYCENLHNVIDGLSPPKGQTKVEAFLGNINGQLKNNSELVIPGATVINSLSASMAVSGIGPHATSAELSSAGDGKTGNAILGITHNLVSIMYQPGQNQSQTTVTCTTVDLSLKMVKTESNSNEENSVLSAKENTMQINMEALARNNNGSAAVAFLTITGMESLLSHEYFHTENLTEMYSDVITAILPSVNNTNLTEPVNFTIQHKKTVSESGMMTCVYWEDTTNEPGGGNTMGWSVKGCWATFTNENYTVCSCSHLSTFALILQIAEPQPDESFLEWLNRMCVIVGLFFFALAILTFLLCSWNPKINNTARLHLCINLALSQLLLLWNSNYVDQKLACKVMAGLLHFLVVASFVWMQLEALQLHLLVRRLSKVQVIQRDGLPRPLLYLVGYGVPFVIVGVSALVYSDGYGATNGQCWLSTNRRFNWALTGPVITILGLNCALFGATLWSLRPTLASMRSDVSQSKDTRLILFKILAQFVILGCTWILGLYQANLFFKVMFIILNSQQGTFLYIVHCLLNKEVREEYIKWLTCSFNKPREGGSVKDAPSVSEDLDKAEENGG
ncbi:adhesion G protein-coupled receptor E1-like [Channa argus]|uniref:adhesion G protein-coupled receptor E1-like n=1 Tax=Channa argus TaxID=215402 RepID=UPI003521786B